MKPLPLPLPACDHRIGQVQFNRSNSDFSNDYLPCSGIAQVLASRLSSETQAGICSLVKISVAKRQESQALREQAKSRVEQFIEPAAQS